MVAKSSSTSTMSAASLATSVPPRPIAIPMSAVRNAGASLTPSPVMATTCPPACSASTSRSFSSGDTRANTPVPATAAEYSASGISVSSAPVTTRRSAGGRWSSPSSVAMADAVVAWSPVIILTSMPAAWQAAMAEVAEARGGSSMACSPTSTNP